MPDQAPPIRSDLEARLIARAWKDEAFAQELRTNPRAAVEQEVARLRPGAKLPEDLEIKVLEETPNTLYLVVPEPHPAVAAGQLSDEELARAAGGQVVTDRACITNGTCVCVYTVC